MLLAYKFATCRLAVFCHYYFFDSAINLGSTLDARLKEHTRGQLGWASTSINGIVVYANKTLHDILWDSDEVVRQETSWTK